MKFLDLADLWTVWSKPKERSFGSGEPAPKARKLGDFLSVLVFLILKLIWGNFTLY